MKWSDTLITLNKSDVVGPDNSDGKIPLVDIPTICNKRAGHTLIDGGTSLNLITPKAYEMLQGAK